MDTPKNRFLELDSLRGIAALLVLFFHYTMGREESDLGFKLGTTGVDLFFIISGFVISFSLNKVNSGLEFVINRVSRLYPTYWFVVVFTFVIMTAYGLTKGANPHWLAFFGNLTMFQFYLNIPDLDGPYWTMIIEMIFYIFMLILFLTHILKYVREIGAVICLSIIMLKFGFWSNSVQEFFVRVPMFQFFPLFFAGVVFYKLRTESKNLVYNYILVFFCLLTQISMIGSSGKSHFYISHTEYAGMLILYFTLFILFAHGKLSFIVNKPLLFFGKISYPLYLIHQYISLGIIIPVLEYKYNVNFWIAAFGVSLPICILLAYFISVYVEKKMSNVFRKKMYALIN